MAVAAVGIMGENDRRLEAPDIAEQLHRHFFDRLLISAAGLLFSGVPRMPLSS